MIRPLLLAALATTAGCDGYWAAAVDAPRAPDARGLRDATTVDARCGSEHRFLAKLVDFDYSDSAATAVAGATFTVQSMPSRTVTTADDGLVDMCVPVDADELMRLVVDAPDTYLDGFVVAAPQYGFVDHSILRTITLERASTFYSTTLGLALDAAKSQVLVINACDGNTAVLDRPHGTPWAAYETAGHSIVWQSGNGGDYVLFPNVDTTQATGTVSWQYGAPRLIPLYAGKWTMLVDCIWWL
jgi:hypothetical protein